MSSSRLHEQHKVNNPQQTTNQSTTQHIDIRNKRALVSESESNIIEAHLTDDHNEDRTQTPINIYCRNQMSSNYMIRETRLQNIVKKALTPTYPKKHIRLLICYKNRKIKNLFIKNSPPTKSIFNVVYQ